MTSTLRCAHSAQGVPGGFDGHTQTSLRPARDERFPLRFRTGELINHWELSEILQHQQRWDYIPADTAAWGWCLKNARQGNLKRFQKGIYRVVRPVEIASSRVLLPFRDMES